jgi:hypothetical protein
MGWRNRRATLALSFVNLVELRQHGSQIERDARYEALGHFLPIRTTMSLAAPQELVTDPRDREILAAGVRRGLRLDRAVAGIRINETGVTIDPFPWTIDNLDSLDAIRGAESDWFAERVADMRNAITLGSIAQRRAKGSPAPDQRLEDLSDTPLTDAQASALLGQARLQFKSVLLPGGGSGDVTHTAFGRYVDWITRGKSVGLRRAQAERLEAQLDRPLEARDYRRPLRTLMFEAAFRDRVRHVLATHCARESLSDRSRAAAAIGIDECLGAWLGEAVAEQAFRAEAEPKPGNYWDFDQAMYLPYVDRYFTDRRIATFIEHAVRRPDRPAALNANALRRNSGHLRTILDSI